MQGTGGVAAITSLNNDYAPFGFPEQADIVHEVAETSTLVTFVAAGLGVAVVPASPSTVADVDAERLRLLPLTDPGAVRDVGVTWSPERRLLPAAELFRAYVVERVAAGGLPGLEP